MKEKERELINQTSSEFPLYVLQTSNKEDSLFLRNKCKDLNTENIAENKDLQHLIARMKVTLAKEQGVGLAAPQIGIQRNLFLFVRIDKPNYPIAVAINPKIVNNPTEKVCFEGDGCLSIPNKGGSSARYPWIEVEYYNEKGDIVKEKLSGYSRDSDFTGVIFQHEYDHLQGVLFTDKLWEENKN